MARPYKKATVDQAEEILLCAANNNFDTLWQFHSTDSFAEWLGIPQHATARRLAHSAYLAVPTAEGFRMRALEAAALIRSGWMIGDPVELLKLPVETEATTAPTVTLDQPIDMQEMADDYATVLATPKLDESEEGLEADIDRLSALDDAAGNPTTVENPIEMLVKNIDQGPAEPPLGTVVDLEPIETTDDALYNGDYGADS